MRRREFVAGLGSAAAWPVVARAQQQTVPVVGYLIPEPFTDTWRDTIAAFKRGLADAGYIDGRNVTIELHSADSQNDRLPTLARELVRRQVSLIKADGVPAAIAAKTATATIPIVFNSGGDPVQLGLVASMNRPGGNITGITSLGGGLIAKRLEMLHQTLPAAKSIAMLANPSNPMTNGLIAEAQTAVRALGIDLSVVNARSQEEITSAFTILINQRVSALLVSADTFYISQMNQLVALAARHRIPTSYNGREFVQAGGLMSYSANFGDSYRLAGNYAGRILKGERPGDLPVQQSTKVLLSLNLKTAKALGLTIPETLLATADEVIQ
jgi:putative tryptophan/tyrosine transport system substrate-binding protein